MSVKRIEIADFTVFHDVTIDFNKNVNVIIGENGSGKTHLLKLIYSAWYHVSDFEFDQRCSHLKDGVPARDTQLSRKGSEYPCVTIVEAIDLPMYIFIPAKEMLSMANITRVSDRYSRDLSIDTTLTDIIKKAQNIQPDIAPPLAKKIVSKLEKIIDGQVFMKPDNSFWVRKNNEMEIPFSMEAEGFRKFGLLWQLVMNESIMPGTVLLWDEPEANINPKLIPVLVEILIELAKNNVQIFVSTHDYVLAKYFEVKGQDSGMITFHSLYRHGEHVRCESNEAFRCLQNNPIVAAFDTLMNEVICRNLGD